MATRFKSAFDVINDGTGHVKSKFVDNVFNDANSVNAGEENAHSEFVDVPLDLITPRSINSYSQEGIDILAKSIRNTNNKLINPIVLARASDYPEDHEVIKKFKEKGIDISKITYVIVAGERRYRAFCQLKEEESNNPNKTKFQTNNPFEKITAQILAKNELLSEKAIYDDSNILARQLSADDVIPQIVLAKERVDTYEKQKEAMQKMGVDPNKRFNFEEYALYFLQTELGIKEWTVATIRNNVTIAKNCDKKIIEAIIDKKISARACRLLPKFPKEKQVELLDVYVNEGAKAYEEKIEKINKKKESKVTRYTHSDIKKILKTDIAYYQKRYDELQKIASGLGGPDKEMANKWVKKFGNLITDADIDLKKL